MKVFKSSINNKSASFKTNKRGMNELVKELNSYLKLSKIQGSEFALKKAKQNGKSLSRDKITKLLDKGSPFIELMSLAGLRHENGFGPGGTTITGIGLVKKKLCLINANIGTKKGGVVDYATSLKNLRLCKIATENKLTTINLVESGGANLPDQDRVFNNYGSMFKDMSQRSKQGVLNISIVFGNSTAGGAYVPGMSDYTIMLKDQAKVFLAGPPLVKMATNEDSSDEELGGAVMHSNLSGVSDFLAENENEAIRIARDIVEFNVSDKIIEEIGDKNPPKFDKDEILGIIPQNLKNPFDIRDLIVRFVDNSQFTEFKSTYGATMKCGWSKINDHKIGIIASNGVIFSESAKKATQFIQLANKSNTPLLFIHNTTGFMVGKRHEQRGIINHGAQLIHAVAGSEVPHITLLVGNSFGAGNYAMCGRAYSPRFLFSWPNSKISVMGGEIAAKVLASVKDSQVNALGKTWNDKEKKIFMKNIIEKFETEGSPYYATARLWDDGVIDPLQTRDIIGNSLSFTQNIINQKRNFGVFRM
mgnify:CR=1 FL=1